MWKRLYNTLSLTDQGTLQQLRNIVSRRNVLSDPSKDVNASEDYFLLVVTCHVLCAAMKLFKMKSLDSFPNGVENEWSFGTKEEKLSKLHSLASEVVVLVDLSTFDSNEHDNEGVKDHVHEYGKAWIWSSKMLYEKEMENVF